MPILNKYNEDEVNKYKEFVKSKDVSFMQAIEWGGVKNNWIQEVVYLEDDEKIIAGMSLLIKKVIKLKSSIIYIPRGPVCDVTNINIIEKLLDEAKPIIKKYNAFVVKMDPQIEFDEKIIEKYKECGFTISKNNEKNIQPIYNMVLNIENKTEYEILNEFSSKTRYNVRLARKKGIKIRYSRDKDDLKIFYDLYKITTIRDKIGCRPYDYFERMISSYNDDNLRIYIAEFNGQALASAIATNFGNEVFYVYGASSNEKRNLMPNYLMQFEMIKWGCQTNCKKYNFGGLLNPSMENGLYRFKVGFCKKEGLKKYVGEIDKVYNKLLYYTYCNGVPLFRKFERIINNLNTH